MSSTVNTVIIEDGTRWPRPAMKMDEEHGFSWRLRYQQEQLTRSDYLAIARIIDAYGYLVMDKTETERNKICKEIQGAVANE